MNDQQIVRKNHGLRRMIAGAGLLFLLLGLACGDKKDGNQLTGPVGNITPPEMPTNFQATPVSSARINLSWTDNSDNEEGFLVFRGPSADSVIQLPDTIPADTTHFEDNGLEPSTLYYYRIYAFNSKGLSNGYDSDSAATDSGTIPLSPSDLQATAVSSSQINLNWTDSSDNESGFKLYYETQTGMSLIDTVGPNVTYYEHKGLAPATRYDYRVFSYNPYGRSSSWAGASATTDSSSGAIPAAPTNLQAIEILSSRIRLIWTDNADNEEGFHIYMKGPQSSTFELMASTGNDTTEYTQEGLTPATLYQFRVFSYNGDGESDAYADAEITTHEGFRLFINYNAEEGTVTREPDLVAYDSGTVVKLTAYPNENYAFEHWEYNYPNQSADSVFYFTMHNTVTIWCRFARMPIISAPSTSDGTFTVVVSYDRWGQGSYSLEEEMYNPGDTVFEVVASGPGGEINDPFEVDLTRSAGTYLYRARIYDAWGRKWSPYSHIHTVTVTGSGSPSPPSDLQATAISNSQIDLSWTDNSNNEDGFAIYAETPTGWSLVSEVGPDITSYEHTGLTPATLYSYRIYSFNSAGQSASYTEASATTPDAVSYTLSIAALPSAGGVITIDPDLSSYREGSNVILTAIPNPGYGFSQWYGVPTGVSTRLSQIVITMDSDYSITGQFIKAPGITVPDNSTDSFDVTLEYEWHYWSSNLDRFELEESTSPVTGFELIDNSPYGDHPNPYIVSLSRGDGTFYYRARVYAASDGGWSPYSDVKSVTVNGSNLPEAPSNLQASVSGDEITLTWQDNSGNESGFTVEGSGSSDFVEFSSWDTDPGITVFYVSGPPGTWYFRVKSFNQYGSSSYSNTVSATITSSPTRTRFINTSDYIIISLIIDGNEYFPQSGTGIPPGSTYEVELTAGTHQFSFAQGFWNEGSRYVLYSWYGTISQPSNSIYEVDLRSPTLSEVLTTMNYCGTGIWEATYITCAPSWDKRAYQFFTNGTYILYQNGIQIESGPYSLVYHDPLNLRFVINIGGHQGTFYETLQYFVMKNGPDQCSTWLEFYCKY